MDALSSRWQDDAALCFFKPNDDPFYLANAYEGVQIFGGIGSGKTSGSGRHLAMAFLRAGFGGLVLCAKKDERKTWEAYAREAGRIDDLMVFDHTGRYRFNFLRYELKRPGEGGGYTENIVRLFTTIVENIERGRGGNGDQYWVRAMQQLMRNAIELCSLSIKEVSVPLLMEVVTSAPTSPRQFRDPDWRRGSRCWQFLEQAHGRKDAGELDEWERYDLDATAAFWVREWPQLDERTRSNVLSMFTTVADSFLRRPFRMLFSTGTSVIPEHSHTGKIIVMDLPVKEFAEAGRAAQVMFKYIWQQAAERRDIEKRPTPVFLWADEAQNFCTPYDMQFQATARSSRVCTVYLTQNLPNYYAEFGDGPGKHRADSLIGNLQTKIFHANSDPETNTLAAETIGKSWHLHHGSNFGAGGGGAAEVNVNIGENTHESFDYDVAPQEFTTLRKGGPIYERQVDAILFQNGRIWSNRRTATRITFTQPETRS